MTTKEKIEVMQAYEEGKTIECNNKRDSDWFELDQPDWNWSGYDYRLKKEKQPITREEITAQWVKDNDVKVGDKVKLGSRGVFQIYEIFGNKILIDLGGYKDFFNIEELKKVTSKIIPFTFEDRELFRDKWVKSVGHKDAEQKIFSISGKGVTLLTYGYVFRNFTWDEALAEIEFIDGKPFGKETWE